jgi:nuclear pore complex protein Nup98-Nup96
MSFGSGGFGGFGSNNQSTGFGSSGGFGSNTNSGKYNLFFLARLDSTFARYDRGCAHEMTSDFDNSSNISNSPFPFPGFGSNTGSGFGQSNTGGSLFGGGNNNTSSPFGSGGTSKPLRVAITSYFWRFYRFASNFQHLSTLAFCQDPPNR